MKDRIIKNLLIVVMILVGFIFIVSVACLYAQEAIACGAASSCTIPIPLLIPSIASLGLIIGIITYYFMVSQFDKKDKNILEYSELLEKILTKDEAEVLKFIAKSQKTTQAKLSSSLNLSRLKVFRIIEKLKQKDIIKKQQDGKSRIIELQEEIKNALKSS